MVEPAVCSLTISVISRSFACWRLRTDARDREPGLGEQHFPFQALTTHAHTRTHPNMIYDMQPILVGIAVVRIALDIFLASPGLQLSVTGYSRNPVHLDHSRTAARFRRTQHDSDDPCLARFLPRSSSLCRFCSLCCIASNDNNLFNQQGQSGSTTFFSFFCFSQ